MLTLKYHKVLVVLANLATHGIKSIYSPGPMLQIRYATNTNEDNDTIQQRKCKRSKTKCELVLFVWTAYI